MTKQFLILVALLISSLTQAHAETLDKARDWTQASREAQASQAPILVLYTADACGYCERLKQDVLNPLLRHGPRHLPAVIREIDINAGGKMTDFNGERIRSRRFKDRYQVFVTPTLLILDRYGKLQANPIVGYDSQDAYRSLLESELEDYRLVHTAADSRVN